MPTNSHFETLPMDALRLQHDALAAKLRACADAPMHRQVTLLPGVLAAQLAFNNATVAAIEHLGRAVLTIQTELVKR